MLEPPDLQNLFNLRHGEKFFIEVFQLLFVLYIDSRRITDVGPLSASTVSPIFRCQQEAVKDSFYIFLQHFLRSIILVCGRNDFHYRTGWIAQFFIHETDPYGNLA